MGLYRVEPLTHLETCVFFSTLYCLQRRSSLKFHRLRSFTAKGKPVSELHIFVTAVHCSCQHSNVRRVCVRLISQLKFIRIFFICYNILSVIYGFICQRQILVNGYYWISIKVTGIKWNIFFRNERDISTYYLFKSNWISAQQYQTYWNPCQLNAF